MNFTDAVCGWSTSLRPSHTLEQAHQRQPLPLQNIWLRQQHGGQSRLVQYHQVSNTCAENNMEMKYVARDNTILV